MRILLFLFVLNSALQAQNQDSLKIKKWAVGISFSPDYNFRIADNPNPDGALQGFKESRMIAIGCGLNGLYRFTKHLGIDFSVVYSSKGERIYVEQLTWISPGTPYDPAIPNSGQPMYITTGSNSTVSYNYLEIPLKINTYVLDKKLKVFPSLGFATNIFIGKTTRLYHRKGDYTETETIHTYNKNNIPAIDLSLVACLGISYDISRRLFMKLEPNYRQFIRPMNDAPVSGYFYSIGCNTGLSYRF